MKMRGRYGAFLMLVFSTIGLYSQNKETKPVKYIQELVAQDSLEKARAQLANNLAIYRSEKKYDSLAMQMQFVGSIKLNNGDKKLSVKKAEALTDEIRNTKDPLAIKIAFSEMGWVYEDVGQLQKAYDLILEAVPFAKRITTPESTDYASVYYSLGYYSTQLGNYPLSKKNYQESLRLLKKSRAKDYVFYNQIYNSLGGLMWQEAKLDSAQYYFKEAVNVLQKTDADDIMNQYYRPALIKSNLVVIYNALGRNEEAIKTSYEVIDGYQNYIKRSTDEARISRVKGQISTTLDNLASFYNTLGEHERAEALMRYNYEQRIKMYEANDINIIISLVVWAEAKTAIRDFEGASKTINKALELLKTSPGADLYWDAAANSARATIYKLTGDIENAKKHYEKAERLYTSTLKGGYNRDVLSHRIELSQFYANHNEPQKAIAVAKDTYVALQKGDLNNTLQDYHQTINLAKVYFLAKDYKEAINYSEEALNLKISNGPDQTTLADSILAQFRKPEAILIHTASKYYSANNKDETELINLLEPLEDAIAILEQRKKVVTTHQDVTILINENEELLNFAKKLRLELYHKTKDASYLDDVISLHESAIYNRIRSRLNLREKVAFKNVPKEVLETENKLRNDVANSLKDPSTEIDTYIRASETWEAFLESLQKKYPDYYRMRYQTLEENILDLQEKIPANTTVVRYLFIENQLYAFVVSHSKKSLVLLDNENTEVQLKELSKEDFSVESKSKSLYQLYQSLWQPLEKHVNTKKVVIIPDRELFNLSFEMLTPKPMKDFEEFSTNSLLANYDISYNFSLLLYKDQRNIINYSENYVGFVPGFNKEMKQSYQIGIKDSIGYDKTYINLLPQPFSESLVKKYSKFFDGNYFMNQNASKTLFMKNAKEHKIIHIGSHAESNNISPELSRLVFAKQLEHPTDVEDNSLYAYEIYNIDLSSNLAILTACETGKPSYQPGEGAMSLAHAFNYAGSESILTSLWDIDEVSSTQIVGYFYDFLSDGLPKDEALKQAKLKYLSTAEGRGASPEYWAGLVLIGNTDPIQFQQASNTSWWWWGLGVFISALLLYFLFKRKRIANN